MPSRGNSPFQRPFESVFALQVGPELTIPYGADGGQPRVQIAARVQGAHFGEKAAAHHTRKAALDTLVEFTAIAGRQGHAQRRDARRFTVRTLEFGQTLPREAVDFQGAQYPLRMIGVDAGRGQRIDGVQLGVQRGPAHAARAAVQIPAQGRVGLRQRRQPHEQSAVVEHGAADENRAPPARANGADGGLRIATEMRR